MIKDNFEKDSDEPGCYIKREGLSIYLRKLEKKFQTDMRYLDYMDHAVSFRRAIVYQVDSLVKAIEARDVSLYHPITIR